MTTQRRRQAYALLAGLLVLGSWWGWRWQTTPALPALPMDQMDAAVAEAVQSALDEVGRAPRSGAAWGKLAMVTAANGYAEQSLVCLAHAERFDPADPRWPYLRGHALLSGDRRAALAALQHALERADSDERRAAIRLRLALASIEDGRIAEADQHLEALRKIEPDGAGIHFILGLLAVERNDRRAIHEHMELLVTNPFARKTANAQLAALALAEGDEGLARIYQQRAAALPADAAWPDPFLHEMGEYAVGRQSRFLEAERLESGGRLREAVALLRQIVADSPDGRSYLALGLGLGKLRDYDEAEQMLRAALRVDGRNLQANHQLGNVLLLKGERHLGTPGDQEAARDLFRQAIAAQDRALHIQADHGMSHLMRGRALRDLGRTDEAIGALREAVLCRPEFADTHLYLGEALAENGQLAEGLRHLDDAVGFAAPGDPRPSAALTKWRAKASSEPPP